MRKLIIVLTALFSAIAVNNINAGITSMTCAEAKQATFDNLQSGETGTDSVAVTGYVTNTNGSISRGQQTFWLDDEQGTTQTFQAYWCNMPDGENPLNRGDKVTIKGFLMNYNGTTAEMKNGDVVILERMSVVLDTIDLSVCEIIAEGEAMSNRAVSDDYFRVAGRVVAVEMTNETYMQETFWMECADDQKRFEAYYVTLQGTEFAQVGDSVLVLGKLTNYNGTIEISNGKAWVIDEESYLTVAQIMTIYDSVDLPDSNTYTVRGYVTSWDYGYPLYDYATFYIDDDEDGSTSILRCLQLVATDDADARLLNVGDYVEVSDCSLDTFSTSRAQLIGGSYRIINATTPPEYKGIITISELIERAERKSIYQLTGVVSNIINSIYGDFDLTDSTGTIYIYNLLTEAGERAMFSQMDINEGDTLTLQGAYHPYMGVHEIKNATFVEVKKYVEQPSQVALHFQNGVDESEITSIMIDIPNPPLIEGFVFSKWVVVGGDVEDIITIQAIYEVDETITSAPTVYTNPANPAQKLIKNGNVYVLTEDKTYTITGIQLSSK